MTKIRYFDEMQQCWKVTEPMGDKVARDSLPYWRKQSNGRAHLVPAKPETGTEWFLRWA